MTTCPSCGADEDRPLEPSSRKYYVCGSYTGAMRGHQSDLCRAWQAIRNVRNLATTDGESAAQLLARVKEMLAL